MIANIDVRIEIDMKNKKVIATIPSALTLLIDGDSSVVVESVVMNDVANLGMKDVEARCSPGKVHIDVRVEVPVLTQLMKWPEGNHSIFDEVDQHLSAMIIEQALAYKGTSKFVQLAGVQRSAEVMEALCQFYEYEASQKASAQPL
jgi:hypothetical protein